VLQYVLYTLAVSLGVGALWIILGKIPDDINFIETWGETYWEIQGFLKSYTEIFAPVYKFTDAPLTTDNLLSRWRMQIGVRVVF
jgi:hypothetical protein